MSVQEIGGELAWVLPDGTLYFAGGDFNNCTVSVCPVELSVYGYRPSLAASGALIGLYSICAVIQTVLGFRYRSWWFMGCMLAGCACEILGYAGRIMYWQNPWAQTGFILQIVMITIGPVFFSGAIYVLLSKIVDYISPKYSHFPSKWFIWIFVTADVISLILQAVGGAMSSMSDGENKAGVDIALAGLSFQVITLVVFVALVIEYLVRSRTVWREAKLPTLFKVFCATLALSTTLILIRCAYRIFELSEGYSRESESLRDEPMFIGLESVMIVLAAYLLIPAHPGPVFERVGLLPADDTPEDQEK